MKQKNPDILDYRIRKIIRRIIISCFVVLVGIGLLSKFAYWYFEDRPQYIEVDFAPIYDEGWNHIEYSTRYNYEGHYWIVKYYDNCYKDCDVWLENFDYYANQLDKNWVHDYGGPFSDYCFNYFRELEDSRIIKAVTYYDFDGNWPSFICVATRQSIRDSDEIELLVMTIHPSLQYLRQF